MGHATSIAGFTDAGWRFLAPVDGLSLLVRSSGETAAYRNGGWQLGIVTCQSVMVDGQQVVADRQPAIANPPGGSSIDLEARAAIVAILAALRSHGLIQE